MKITTKKRSSVRLPNGTLLEFSFRAGFGSALGVFGPSLLAWLSPDPEAQDALAIESDWRRVGTDLREAADALHAR